MHQSNTFKYYGAKYGTLVVGIITLGLITVLILNNSEVRINGEKQNATFQNSFPIYILPLVFIPLGLYFRNKVKFLKLSNSQFELSDGNYHRISNWKDIEKIKTLWFVSPNMYSVKFMDEDKTHFFVTSGWSISFFSFTWDLSEMGKIIKRNKNRYDY